MQKLDIPYDFDFDLIGISSHEKGYKLAWLLNQKLHISLTKSPDIQIDFLDNGYLSLLNYRFQTLHDTYRLIRNRAILSEGGGRPFLLPELDAFDYLLIIDNQTKSIDLSKIESQLNSLSAIQYWLKIDPTTLKNKDNLIFFDD